MSFNSLIFLFLFLPAFLCLFYVCPKKYRYLIILLGSTVFYFYSGVFNGILLVIISIINYFLGIWLGKTKNNKYLLGLALFLNIGTLAFFKYNDSFLLPLGISFYTFNNISYLVDVKNKKISYEKNICYYFTYSLLFCHVTMGPITSYETVKKGLTNPNDSFNTFTAGFRRFLNGLIKKVLIADNLGLLFTTLLSAEEKSTMLGLLTLITFALQLYIDFSSYTDMAIGLGKMLGINYPENFDYPYLALSITDFWRKWHMSLTKFFTRYVYIPLGGNRVSKFRHLFNIMVVWLLTGIWHGNTWNFLFWGLYYGIILIIEKHFLNKYLEKMPNFFRHFYVIVIVLIGYIFFMTGDIKTMKDFVSSLFTTRFLNTTFFFYLKENFLLLLIGVVLCFKMPNKLKVKIQSNKLAMGIMLASYIILFVITISYLVSGSYLPFLYNAF